MTLSKADIKIFQELLDDRLDVALKENNKVLKAELSEYIDSRLNQIKDEIKEYIHKINTETKNQIFNLIDKFTKEISANRDERITMAHQISRNTKRIEKLEDKVLTN